MRNGLIRGAMATLLGLVLAAGAAGPSWAANSVRFGANLSAAPWAGAPTCAALGQPSCLGYSIVPTSYAPLRAGIVRSIRVRTANVPQGPMRTMILRSYYQNNPSSPGHPNYFCCWVKAYGPVFVPKPGTITAVRTNLGMIEQPVPPSGDYHSVAANDFLALAILNSSTPVPLAYRPGTQDLAFYYAPAPSPSTVPPGNPLPGSQGAGQYGYELLLNATIEPVG